MYERSEEDPGHLIWTSRGPEIGEGGNRLGREGV